MDHSQATETEYVVPSDPQLAFLQGEIVGLRHAVEELKTAIDMIGQQNNWLCENMQSLFSFVNQMGQNGGGIRGLVKALKETPAPQLNEQVEVSND